MKSKFLIFTFLSQKWDYHMTIHPSFHIFWGHLSLPTHFYVHEKTWIENEQTTFPWLSWHWRPLTWTEQMRAVPPGPGTASQPCCFHKTTSSPPPKLWILVGIWMGTNGLQLTFHDAQLGALKWQPISCPDTVLNQLLWRLNNPVLKLCSGWHLRISGTVHCD